MRKHALHFPLPFADKRSLEVGERPHHRQHQVRHLDLFKLTFSGMPSRGAPCLRQVRAGKRDTTYLNTKGGRYGYHHDGPRPRGRTNQSAGHGNTGRDGPVRL